MEKINGKTVRLFHILWELESSSIRSFFGWCPDGFGRFITTNTYTSSGEKD